QAESPSAVVAEGDKGVPFAVSTRRRSGGDASPCECVGEPRGAERAEGKVLFRPRYGHLSDHRVRRHLALSFVTGELDHALTHGAQVSPRRPDDLGADTVRLAYQPQQDVLGADVVVVELHRLAQ